MPTAEIYNSKGEYAGYAKFGANGEYLGSHGGYGARRRQNNPHNGASRLQNNIVTSGARGKARNEYLY